VKNGLRKKVLLAVGHRQLEEYLEAQLNKEFEFVGTTVYREGILRAIGQKSPDIVVVRETLNGTENIMSIVYSIRTNYPDVRIVFIAGNRESGDELLATLVNYGVYDILNGSNIPAQKIVSLIRKPNTYSDVKHFQPVPLLDEERNRVLFEAPEAKKEVEVIEIINEGNKNEVKDEETKIIYEPPNEEIEDDDEEEKLKFINKIRLPKVDIGRQRKKETQTFTGIGSVASERIITFVGGKSGVGTTSIAINTAFLLAKKGYKVIYVEFNEKYPAVSYWYELGLTSYGIDSCIEALNERKFGEIKKAIIRTKDLKKTPSSMQKIYKAFPDTLDFMFFSKEYLSGLKEDLKRRNSKELFLHLMYQLGYDFVIIDVSSDMENEATQNGLIFSNKIFSVITQDVSSVGYHVFNMNMLEKKGIDIASKSIYVVNRYTPNSNFSLKDIGGWIETDNLLTVPAYDKDFINANLEGLPVVIYSKNPELVNSIEKIAVAILT